MFAKKSTYGQNRRNFQKIGIFDNNPKIWGCSLFCNFFITFIELFPKIF